MKRAVILHSYGQTSEGHWYPWLKRKLQNRGYHVWSPNMPTPDKPNARAVTDFLLANKDWDFNDNVIIGHSWGAVQILHLLQNLPADMRVRAAVPVSVYSQVLAEEPDWEQLKGLFEEPFEFAKIKAAAHKFLFVHGDDDPWCDPKQAEYLAGQVRGELVFIKGGQHFSTSLDPAYTRFPALIELLETRGLI
ncbi:MAG TPA: alpha/beta hydrolase [Candidatus Limnocylindrales bacterium]|nr:alpha/beta hydrolase [Candidatus Limnocylindrales bacterium]